MLRNIVDNAFHGETWQETNSGWRVFISSCKSGTDVYLHWKVKDTGIFTSDSLAIYKAKFRRRTSHEPNRMLMRENKGYFSFAFDSAHVKYGV